MKLVALENVVEILDNMRIPVNSTERSSRSGSVPYYGATGQVGTIDRAIFNETLILLGEDGVPFFDANKHKAYEISGPSWVNNHAHVLRAKSDLIVQRYLLHFLNGFNYTGYVNGATRLKLTQADMKRIPVPLPSLEKQHEIVDKLDSAFADIDLLEENLKLSDQKSKQLLQSILSGSFANSGVKHEPGGTLSDQRQTWPSVALKDFCKMYQPPTISTKEMIPSGEYVVYGANGPIGRYNKFNHEEPQLLVTCRGATCGAVNMSEPFAWINGNAMVIQPNLDLATLDYMKYAFLGGIDVSSSITGSAQPQITRTTLEVIKVPLPSLDRQLEIVEKLDFVFTEIEVLRSRLKLKKDFVGALRQSLLSGAFNQEKEVP